MTDASDRPVDQSSADGAGEPGKKKRRRRRGGRGRSKGEGAGSAGEASDVSSDAASGGEDAGDSGHSSADRGPREDRGGDRGGDGGEDGGQRGGKKRRRGRGKKGDGALPPDLAAADKEPERFRKAKTTTFTKESFAVDKSFADLGLSGPLLEGLEEAGFRHPTHIQAQLVPVALTGVDILGQAKTGTGKTMAFGLPVLARCEPGDEFQALILAPTRELAIQIRQDLDEVIGPTGLTTAAVYGGQAISTQAKALSKHPEIIVGTPGRVMDMAERGYLRFNAFRMVVLDEVDRMFDFGFRDDMRKILSQCPKDRQTIFVSATFTEEIEKLARRYMNEPEKLVVSSGSLTVELVKQEYVTCEPWDKRRMLAHILTHEEPALTLVFCQMKRTVDKVVESLAKHGIEAHAIHGDMSQAQRNRVMEKFRSGTLSVLVASDLASRGIDVDGITHVVNFDLPNDPDLYVHRIGRTARAGRSGEAWSLVTPAQGGLLTDIEMLINAEIPKREYPEFVPSPRPENFRDETPGGRPAVVIEGVDPKANRNRFEAADLPAEKELSEAEKASKFPGGIVPGKLPPRSLGGRARTRRR